MPMGLRKSTLAVVSLAALAAVVQCQEATTPIPGGGLPQVVVDACNFTGPLPSPGADGDFMGPLQRASTPLANYAYYRFGNSSSGRPPLLMINGFASTCTSWGVEFPMALAEDQEVVIFDPRGQGFSEDLDPTAPLTVPGLANDTLDLISTIGLDRPNVLGLSLGAMIATALAALHGTEVGRIVVVSGSAGSPNSVFATANAVEIVTDPNATVLDGASILFPVDTPEGLAGWCDSELDQLAAKQSPVNATTTARQSRAIVDFFYGPGVWELLPGIETPMLLVGGADDELVPADNLKLMAQQLRSPWWQAEVVIYPDSRHAAWHQNMASVLQLVEQFLGEADLPVGSEGP